MRIGREKDNIPYMKTPPSLQIKFGIDRENVAVCLDKKGNIKGNFISVHKQKNPDNAFLKNTIYYIDMQKYEVSRYAEIMNKVIKS